MSCCFLKGVSRGFVVFAISASQDGGGLVDKKNTWSALFVVEEPKFKHAQIKGKILDAYEAFEVARYDIQYCDWRARQDLLTIMLLHEKVTKFPSFYTYEKD